MRWEASAVSEEEGKHSDALEILRQYVQRYSDFFLVCLTGTLGFQQEEITVIDS